MAVPRVLLVLTMLLAGACGRAQLNEETGDGGAGGDAGLSPDSGVVLTGTSTRSCAPNDGPATAIALGQGLTCGGAASSDIDFLLWGAALDAGVKYAIAGGFNGSSASAHRCPTPNGCVAGGGGYVRIDVVTDNRIDGYYTTTFPDAGVEAASFSVTRCAQSGPICG